MVCPQENYIVLRKWQIILCVFPKGKLQCAEEMADNFMFCPKENYIVLKKWHIILYVLPKGKLHCAEEMAYNFICFAQRKTTLC